jgi:hypothetical protein
MSLRIRRGTNSQRTGITFDLGEIVYTTDTQKLYIGDGVTAGGKHVLETSVGNGFTFNPTTQQVDFAIGNLFLTTTQVTEGSNQYFTTERAQDAVGAALVAGNSFNTGITFTYDDANNRITAISTGGATTTVSSDTNPSLGGNLNASSFNITGVGSLGATTITATNLGGNINVGSYNITGTGSISASSITANTLGGNLNANSYNITNIGNLGASTLTAANLGGNLNASSYNITSIGSLSATTFTANNLGGNLNTGIHAITGTGSISTGTITATNLGGNLNTGSFNLTGTGNITTDTITAANLGRALSLNSYNIIGTGSIAISGTVQGVNGVFIGNGGVTTDRINVSDVNTTGLSIFQKVNSDLELNYFNGTKSAKTSVLPGDNLGQISFKSWNGTNFDCISVGINASVNGDATITDLFPKSLLRLFVGGGGSDGPRIATFNYLGVFNAPALQTTVYSVAGTALPSAATVGVGARAFVSDASATTFASAYVGSGSNKVPVYSDGSVWRIG